MLNSIRCKAAIAIAACTTLATPAAAGNVSSNLGVNATVTANCTISTSALDFGNIDTLSATPVTGTGGFTVACTNGSGWTATASVGGGSGATFATRRMTFGANTLDYSLYTNSGYGTVWGDGTGGSGTITGTGTGASQNITVYGRIPGSQTSVPVGGYSDTVSVTITY